MELLKEQKLSKFPRNTEASTRVTLMNYQSISITSTSGRTGQETFKTPKKVNYKYSIDA